MNPNLFDSDKKEIFLFLAKAYMKDVKYRDALYSQVREIAKEHDEDIDFLGLPYEGNNISNAIVTVLDGKYEDFSYFVFDCDGDFEKYNQGVTLKDETHPNVHSLEDLYDFIVSQESE